MHGVITVLFVKFFNKINVFTHQMPVCIMRFHSPQKLLPKLPPVLIPMHNISSIGNFEQKIGR